MQYSMLLEELHINFPDYVDYFDVQCQSKLIDTLQPDNDNKQSPVANFGNCHHPKFSMRDAHFFPFFQDLRQSRNDPISVGTSVTVSAPYKPTYADTLTGAHSRSISPLIMIIEAQAAAQKSPRLASPKPSKLDRSVRERTQPVETLLRNWKVPAPWRDLSFWFQAISLHDAGARFGVVHAFSLNLRPDIEQLAREQPSASSWLQKRISRELRIAFGGTVEFWFVLESADKGKRLHLHGEMILPDGDSTIARRGLRRAAGEWKHVRQHQCHTSELPDDGWVSYALKDIRMNSARSRAAHLRGFTGEPYAASQGLRSSARAYYEADRAEVITRLKTPA